MDRDRFEVLVVEDYGNLLEVIKRLCKDKKTTIIALDILDMLSDFQRILNEDNRSEIDTTVLDSMPDESCLHVELRLFPAINIIFVGGHFIVILVNRDQTCSRFLSCQLFVYARS